MKAYHAIFLAVCLVMTQVVGNGGADAQTLRTTQKAGGPAGLPGQALCNDDEELAGLYGNAGWYIDSVGIICVRINRATGAWRGEPRTGLRLGGGGGFPYDLKCPRNQVVSGFRGRASMLVDRLEIECRRLGSDGRVSGFTVKVGSAGGSGGSAFGPYRCPGDRPAFGVLTWSGAFMDGLVLGCRP